MARNGTSDIHFGEARVRGAAEAVSGGFVERDGEAWYRIARFDRMQPFFMTLVSAFDHWMFLSSNGGLTCGRRNPDHALFPYSTDDKIHDADVATGPQTALRVERDGRTRLWRPLGRDVPVYAVERNLYKHPFGNRLVFEEINHDLQLAFSYAWATGERFGFIRRCTLVNLGGTGVRVDLLDGLRNLLPSGVTRALQTNMSTLVDAYKQAEAHPDLAAALYTLSSIPSDRAEPSEALRATVAWSEGLDASRVVLSADEVPVFCAGGEPRAERVRTGQRGAFLVQASLDLAAGEARTWYTVADVGLGPVQVPALLSEVARGGLAEALEADIAEGSRRLLQLAVEADGCQRSSDRLVATRHFSNTLFNLMRGGTFPDGYRFPVADFLAFVGSWNRPLRQAFAAKLGAGDTRVDRAAALSAARAGGDPDMERLVLEYLPLSFSRRHGDPSRPWNLFSIDLRNPDGSARLDYQGNWRDIFQNWEALAISYPQYIESYVAKFVNASTVDGYNPFRISRAGFEWEVLHPDDPWSNIGYWGDHQVNYLVRLLELSRRYHPGELERLLHREIFVYADVPYRLQGYAASVADPRNTVGYDPGAAAAIAARVADLGSDGRLAVRPDGALCRANLLEKLLLPALVKLGNFVPGGGIWMNTQRPEWNDANNALVGYGLSMVTLCYLRRYLLLLADLLGADPAGEYALSEEVSGFFRAIDEGLNDHRGLLGGALDDRGRRRFMDDLGARSEAYRSLAYAGFSGRKSGVGKGALLDFIALAVRYLDHTIASGRREDGLFHSYNLLRFGREGFGVDPLPEMLEGQVAAIQSGWLDPPQTLELLDALRASRLYRPDQQSYLLYPDRVPTPFVERNVIPGQLLGGSAWIEAELASGRQRYLARDVDGCARFAPFRNVGELREALDADPDVSADDADRLCGIYEEVFDHRQFTGRSGAMYKYEGLGCIYWHMVSKLTLAVAEAVASAADSGADARVVERLHGHYVQAREGLGVHKAPDRYGAFPVDPYSHTPAFAGVQQPGMTGQVKEDIITRFLELGVHVENGEVVFAPSLLSRDEFLTGAPDEAVAWSPCTGPREAAGAGTLAFTLCGVPVTYRLADAPAIRVRLAGAAEPEFIDGTVLGETFSRALFERDGRIVEIEVELPSASLR